MIFWRQVLVRNANQRLHQSPQQAAVNLNRGAGDIAGTLGGQERHKGGKLGWLAHSSQRYPGIERFQDLIVCFALAFSTIF